MWKKIRDSKWFYVVLSILMSAVLWVYVVNVVNPDKPKTIDGIPVVFTGTDVLATRNLIITEGAEQTFTLRINTKLDLLSKLTQDSVILKADVSKITGPGEYKIQLSQPTYPANISSSSVEITTDAEDMYVTLTVAKLGSKEIPVQVEFMGSIAEGYQLGEPSVTPSVVGISGQSDLINQVVYAKVVLSQKDLSETYTSDLSFVYVGTDGQEIPAENITSNVDTVHIIYPVVQVKEVPLALDYIYGGGITADNFDQYVDVHFEPADTISISGPQEELENLTQLVVGQIDLSQIVTAKSFSFPIQLAEDLTNETGNVEVKVTVTVKGMPTKEFNVDNITVVNVPDGFVPQLVTQARQIIVRGPQEALDAIFAAQLRVVADASYAATAGGRYTVPATVYLDGSGEVSVIGSYNVVIELSVEGT